MSANQYQVPSSKRNYTNELENISSKMRHGLFTQPPPLLLGDKYNDSLKSQGNQKMILINPTLKKNYEPSLFQDPNYISISNPFLNYLKLTKDDPYKEPFKQKQIYEKEKVMAIIHEQPFKPTDTIKNKLTSEFEHMKEFDDKQYKRRQASGQVRTESRNFQTNPPKRGVGNSTTGHLFNPVKYVADAYDAYEEADRKERIQHRSKFLLTKKGFSSTSYGNRPFTADLKLFDGAGYVKTAPKNLNCQDQPFRPSNPNKGGLQGCFERVEYLEEGGYCQKTKRGVQERLSLSQTNQRPWRENPNDLFSRPQPSIMSKSYRRRNNTKNI